MVKASPTSLQRATKSSHNGAFENLFAQGLDMSDIISNTNYRSAAEELLQIKEKERRQRQIHEDEETKMQEALQARRRLRNLKSSSQSNRSTSNDNHPRSFEVVDALVRMHDSDSTLSSDISRKKNTTASRKDNRRIKQQQQQLQKKRSSGITNRNHDHFLKPSTLKKKKRTKY